MIKGMYCTHYCTLQCTNTLINRMVGHFVKCHKKELHHQHVTRVHSETMQCGNLMPWNGTYNTRQNRKHY